jgi:microcystin-dependent protein
MTVSSETNKVSYNGGGGVVTFPYTFKIFADEDLLVVIRDADGVETTQALTSDYTVTGAGSDSGGNVVMGTAPVSGETLVIKRELELVQETDYPPNDPFPAEAHEDALDRLTMEVQQLKEEIDRAFTFPLTYAGSGSKEMPEPLADYLLGWKSDGTGLENKTGLSANAVVTSFMATLLAASTAGAAQTILGISAFIKTLLDDADAATARATLGIGDDAGIIKMYGGSTAPLGYLLCDGASYLQADYAALFAVIGTTYGSADGTHFNVPDLQGRVPIGVGTGTGGGAAGTGKPTGGSALTAVARARWKGEETHQLSTAELASHTHSLSVLGDTGPGQLVAGTGQATQNVSATGSAGSGTAHNIIQPVMGVNFIIKT